MSHQRITSLELGRIIAICAVMTIHCLLFKTSPLFFDEPWLGRIIDQLCRFAVPFFFILTGFLIQPKLTANPMGTLWSYAKPLAVIWIVWSIIYLLAPLNLMAVMTDGYLAERQMYWDTLTAKPLNSLMEGGLVHLWYLVALIMGVTLIALALQLKLRPLLLPLSLLLFVYGVLAGSYFNVTDIPSPFYTRNGPFLSLLMIFCGFEIRRLNLTLSPGKAMALLVTGMLIHFTEAYVLMSYDVEFRIHDYLFGTPLWGLGIFFYLLAKPNLGNHKWVLTIASWTLCLYVSHLLVVIYMHNLTGFLGIAGISKDLTIWAGTFVFSTLLTLLIQYTPLRRILLR